MAIKQYTGILAHGMSNNFKGKTMKTAISKKTKAQANAEFNNLQIPGIPALQFVPLELIETAIQIRTKFDQESIEELADDIKARGMLQPVLLRPLAGGKFLMIAGERRLRAARFAELGNIPALIGEVDDETATLMQLAENIHREELNLQDECQAIKKLYDTLGSLDKVTAIVKKSKPWVSKRYAITQTKLHYTANQLLADGTTEDIELLKAFSSLCNLIGWNKIQDWRTKISKGKAGRNEIREALKTAKEADKAKRAKEAAKAEKISHAKPKEPPPPPPWTIETSMKRLSVSLTYCNADKNAIDEFNSWDEEKKQELENRLNSMIVLGASPDGFRLIGKLVMHDVYNTPYNDIDLMALITGHAKNAPINIVEFLEQLQTPRETT